MMYLGNIDTKNEIKSIGPKNYNFGNCDKEFHDNYPLNLICLEKNCLENRLICVMCNYENHRQHNIVPLKIFINKFRESFNDFQDKTPKKQIEIKELKEIYNQIHKIIQEFNEKILSNNSFLQKTIRVFSEKEINLLKLDTELDNNEPLLTFDNEISPNGIEAKKAIKKMLERIQYEKKANISDICDITFIHPNNDHIISEKSERINKKAKIIKQKISDYLFDEMIKTTKSYENITDILYFKNINQINESDIHITTMNILDSKEKFIFCFINDIIENTKFSFILFYEKKANIFNENSGEFINIKFDYDFKNIINLQFFYIKTNNIIIQIDEDKNTIFYKLFLEKEKIMLIKLNELDDLKIFKNYYFSIKSEKLLTAIQNKMSIYNFKLENNKIRIIHEISLEFENKIELFCDSIDDILILFKNLEEKKIFKLEKNNLLTNIVNFSTKNIVLNFCKDEEKNNLFITYEFNEDENKNILKVYNNSKEKEFILVDNLKLFDEKSENEMYFINFNRFYIVRENVINLIRLDFIN